MLKGGVHRQYWNNQTRWSLHPAEDWDLFWPFWQRVGYENSVFELNFPKNKNVLVSHCQWRRWPKQLFVCISQTSYWSNLGCWLSIDGVVRHNPTRCCVHCPVDGYCRSWKSRSIRWCSYTEERESPLNATVKKSLTVVELDTVPSYSLGEPPRAQFPTYVTWESWSSMIWVLISN